MRIPIEIVMYRKLRALPRFLPCALLALPVLSAPAVGHADEDGRLQFTAFVQLTAESTEADDGIAFGANSVRLRGVYEEGRFSGRLMLDLNVKDPEVRAPGALPNVIADLFVDYRLARNHRLRMGLFKTPVGFDFNLPKQSLDLTKRGMDAGLVLSRNVGVMLSGRRIGTRFGYDVGVFNVAGRSAATAHTDDQVGDDGSWVGRLMYDDGPWHLETSHGVSRNAGGPNTADYTVTDAAWSYAPGPWTFKLEWIEGQNVLGNADRDERVVLGHLGYRVADGLELILRHNDGRSRVAGAETGLRNTFVGANVWFARMANSEARVQLNYVFASGETDRYTGIRGFRSDAVLLQFQWLVSR